MPQGGHTVQQSISHLQKMREKLKFDHPFYNNTEIAYEIILQEILFGDLKPGERVPQENLASILNMSRTPVRDTPLRLGQEQYLERNSTNGFQVTKPRLKEYADLCEFRLALEPRAAYFAARNISVEDLEKLRQNLEKMEKTAQNSENKYQIMELDKKFHELIAKGCGNEYIRDAILQYQRKQVFNMHFSLQEKNIRFVYNKHRSIYEAIAHSDENEAQKQMYSHLQFYIKNMYGVYE